MLTYDKADLERFFGMLARLGRGGGGGGGGARAAAFVERQQQRQH